MQYVVFDDDHLEFFHVESRVHLNCAFVDHFDNTALFAAVLFGGLTVLHSSRPLITLTTLRFIIFVLGLFSVFVEDRLINFLSLFLALVEIIWISAYNQDSKIHGVKSHINMQEELLRDARNTYRGPGLSAVFHAGIGVDVIHQDLHVVRADLGDLLWVGEDGDWVKGGDQHAAGEGFGEVVFEAFFDDPPRLIRHPQRLKRLQKYRWAFVTHVTHHVNCALEASDA